MAASINAVYSRPEVISALLAASSSRKRRRRRCMARMLLPSAITSSPSVMPDTSIASSTTPHGCLAIVAFFSDSRLATVVLAPELSAMYFLCRSLPNRLKDFREDSNWAAWCVGSLRHTAMYFLCFSFFQSGQRLTKRWSEQPPASRFSIVRVFSMRLDYSWWLSLSFSLEGSRCAIITSLRILSTRLCR